MQDGLPAQSYGVSVCAVHVSLKSIMPEGLPASLRCTVRYAPGGGQAGERTEYTHPPQPA